MKKQNGFGAVEIVLLIVIVGLIGFVIWRVMDARNLYESTGENNMSNPQEVNVPPVTNKKDLEKVEKQLDKTSIEGSYESDLNSESSF